MRGAGSGHHGPFGRNICGVRERACRPGQPEYGLQVHATSDDHGERADRGGGVAAQLGRGDEPEVPGRHGQLAQAPDHAQDRNARGAGRVAEQALMVRRTDLVEDHAADAGPLIPRRETVQQGGGRRADPGRVDHQHDGRAEQPRDVRGRREVPAAGRAVEQAHHALDDRDVGRGRGAGPVGEHRHDLVLADQPRVEVAARASGRQRVVAGVDVVRADLVWRDGQAALAQRAEQPGGDRCLAVTAARGRDDDTRHGYHSMPRWPF